MFVSLSYSLGHCSVMKKIIIQKKVGEGLSIVDDASTAISEKFSEKRETYRDRDMFLFFNN